MQKDLLDICHRIDGFNSDCEQKYIKEKRYRKKEKEIAGFSKTKNKTGTKIKQLLQDIERLY